MTTVMIVAADASVRHPGAGRDPLSLEWIPDIASRFRNDVWWPAGGVDEARP